MNAAADERARVPIDHILAYMIEMLAAGSSSARYVHLLATVPTP